MPHSSVSSRVSSSAWASLPSKPGIYIYKNTHEDILYIGKAKSLRDRVHSYFQPPTRLGPKTAALVSQIATIEHIEVQSEIEALLLESTLIKKFKPQYNIIAKDDKSPYYIHITREEFPKPVINHDPQKALAGPFLNSLTARKILKQFRRIAPYCIAVRPVKKPCFYSHLGLCDPCPGSSHSNKKIYATNISRLRRLLSGQFSQVSSQLSKEMQVYSKNLAFEKAAEIKAKVLALQSLLTIPVSPDEYLANPNLVQDKRQESLEALSAVLSQYLKFPPPKVGGGLGGGMLSRIELYDNAHLSGTSATAAMTVAIDGETNSKFYRHFTIKTTTAPDDVQMMHEVLTRRLAHTDWPTPNLIVLDGGKAQLSAMPDTKIPVISLAKRQETIVIPYQNEFIEINLDRDNPGLRLLQRLRDEAHRFSRRLHHKHRSAIIKS